MKCKLHNTTLISFVHTFQQYYKDRKNYTIDYHLFAGFYFVVQICIFWIYGLTLSGHTYFLMITLFISMAILLLTTEPYKKEFALFNILDFLVMLWQAIVTTSVVFCDGSTLEYSVSQKFNFYSWNC